MGNIRIVQLGCGYWGPNLMRNLVANPAVEVVGLVDTDNKVGDWLPGHDPEVPFTTNTTVEQLDKWDTRALVLATPAGTHFDLA